VLEAEIVEQTSLHLQLLLALLPRKEDPARVSCRQVVRHHLPMVEAGLGRLLLSAAKELLEPCEAKCELILRHEVEGSLGW